MERLRPARRADSSDVLKLATAPAPDGSERHMSIKDFGAGGLDSALALLEHLTDSE